MGTMIFQLPADLSRDAASELERAWVSGLDHMPWPTQAQVDHHRLLVQRRVGESGCLVAPWNMEGAGRLMGASATLAERALPYNFLLELARGKINQLRGQTARWQEAGLPLTATLEELSHGAAHALCRAATAADQEETTSAAQLALAMSYRAAEELVHRCLDHFLLAGS